MGLWSWISRHVRGHGTKAERDLAQVKARALAEAVILGLPTSVASEVMVRTADPQEMAEVLRGLCAIRSVIRDQEKLWLVARIQETYPTLRRLAATRELSAEWLEHTASAMRIAVEHFPKVKFETEEMERLLDSVLTDESQPQNQDLPWSANPGCFERHLQRKHNNPLFPGPERLVTEEQITLARDRDRADALQLVEDVKVVQLAIAELEHPSLGDVDRIRQRIDDLLHSAAQVGGDMSNRIVKMLDDTRESVMNAWCAGVGGNDKALEALEHAEAHQRLRTLVVNNPFVAQMLRKDTPIKPEDVVPALLCESPETIRIAMQVIDGDTRTRMRQGAEEAARRARDEGADVLMLEERLRALDS